MTAVDLNADLGEGCPYDADLMPLLTSASIACGGHAGNADTMRSALALARRHAVQVGAHPGYPDPHHFGRRDLDLPADRLRQTLHDQIRVLQTLAAEEGISVAYLKPHGALYNRACRDASVAEVIAGVAREWGLALLGLPASELEREARRIGVRFVPEGFADRRYRPDGSLVPRSEKDAMISDPREGVEQVLWLIREQGVQTICIHGDQAQAVAFATALRQALHDAGVVVQRFAAG